MWSFDPGSPIIVFPTLTCDPYLLSFLIYAQGIRRLFMCSYYEIWNIQKEHRSQYDNMNFHKVAAHTEKQSIAPHLQGSLLAVS